jgi:hypothetical protein
MHQWAAKFPLVVLCWMVLTAFSGCQERHRWTKSGVGAGQSDLDQAACQSLATRQANKEYDRELLILETTGSADGGRLPQTFAKIDAQKREKKLFEACLGARGYNAQLVK